MGLGALEKYREIKSSREAAIVSIFLFSILTIVMAVKVLLAFGILDLLVLAFSVAVLVQSILVLKNLAKLQTLLFSNVAISGRLYIPKPILYQAVFWYVLKYS